MLSASLNKTFLSFTYNIAHILLHLHVETSYCLMLQEIFMFLTKQLRGLEDPEAPSFKRYFYLLEVSFVNTVICYSLLPDVSLRQFLTQIINGKNSLIVSLLHLFITLILYLALSYFECIYAFDTQCQL